MARETHLTPVEVFCSYAHEDEAWLHKLEAHVSLLQRQGLISLWHDRRITAGTDWKQTIDHYLETASVILLLVSADFLASDYCYGVEMQRALERHEAHEARVIPILVRPVEWTDAPFAHVQALPADAKPLSTWRDRDTALADVAAGLRRVIAEDLPFLLAFAPRANLPAIWNVPYPRNPFFTGRDTLLTLAHQHLHAGHTMALSQPQAVSGLGGIGKTQIAVEYAYRYRQEYRAVLWMHAERWETLLSSASELAQVLRLPEREEQEQQRVVEAVKQWLVRHRQWLLILDNADDLDLLPAFLPHASEGHVLLTTRAWDMQRLAQRIEVESLPTEVGAHFLLQRAGRLAMDASLAQADAREHALACQIAEQLGGLPLALDQAGAYLEATGMRLSAYQQVYQTHRRELHQRRGARVPDHPQPVATTWALSLASIEQQDPAAGEMLRLCAFLAPDAIPEELLTRGATHLGPVLAPVVGDPFRLGQAIEVLRTYSLIRRDPQSQTLSLHRLVQAVVTDEMDEATRQQWKQRVLRWLRAVVPGYSFPEWPVWEHVLGQVQAVMTWVTQEDLLVVAETATVLQRAGWYLTERARYQEAEPLLTRALTVLSEALGPEHLDTATILHLLARLYQAQGRYEEAKPLYQRALRIYEQALGPEHPNAAAPLHELASLYQDQGKYGEAKPLYQRALRIKEQVLGPEHPNTAATLHELARLYQNQGKYGEAQPLYQRALRILEQTLGPKHPNTAIILHTLAWLYQVQGRYEKAETLYQRALRIKEQALGPEHPEVAITLHTLARLYQVQGRYEKAETLCLQALRISERALSPEHPDTATERALLAQIMQSQGRYAEARTLYRQALSIQEQTLGSEHPRIARTLSAWASWHEEQGQIHEALMLYQRVLHLRQRVLGPDHPDTHEVAQRLAAVKHRVKHEGTTASHGPGRDEQSEEL